MITSDSPQDTWSEEKTIEADLEVEGKVDTSPGGMDDLVGAT